MSDTGLALTDPRLLLEAARVFNAPRSGYQSAAASVAEQALAAVKVLRTSKPDAVEPEVEQAIVGDCAALRLGGRVDGGYTDALALLDEQIDRKQPNGTTDEKQNDVNGRLHLLRALARGQQYKATQDKAIFDDIRKDLVFAFAQRPELKDINWPFWRPRGGEAAEADLAPVYEATKQDPTWQGIWERRGRDADKGAQAPTPAASATVSDHLGAAAPQKSDDAAAAQKPADPSTATAQRPAELQATAMATAPQRSARLHRAEVQRPPSSLVADPPPPAAPVTTPEQAAPRTEEEDWIGQLLRNFALLEEVSVQARASLDFRRRLAAMLEQLAPDAEPEAEPTTSEGEAQAPARPADETGPKSADEEK